MKNLYRISRIRHLAMGITLCLSTLALTGCGGETTTIDTNTGTGGGTTGNWSNASKGTIVGTPIQGLSYRTATQSGVTNSLGQFAYLPGEEVTFSVSGLTLGSVTADSSIATTSFTRDVETTQLLLSLDTNPSPNIIDVTSVFIPASTLQDIQNYWNTTEVFDNTTMPNTLLTEIQNSTPVTLNRTTWASAQDASLYLKDTLSTGQSWIESEVSGKAFYAHYQDELALWQLYHGGNASFISDTQGDNNNATEQTGSWYLAESGALVVNIDNTSLNVYKLSKTSNIRDLYFHVPNDAEQTGHGHWIEPLAYSTSLLNNKIYRSDYTTTNNVSCKDSMAYYVSTFTYKSICGGETSSTSGSVEGSNNIFDMIELIAVGDNGNPIVDRRMLIEGDTNNGKFLSIAYDNNTLISLDTETAIAGNAEVF